jgi:hypothetical protein
MDLVRSTIQTGVAIVEADVVAYPPAVIVS